MHEGFTFCYIPEETRTQPETDTKDKCCLCDVNKNWCNISQDCTEDNRKEEEEHTYCCYQNIPYCCESETKLLSSEQKEYHDSPCDQNLYENTIMSSARLGIIISTE